MVALRRWRVERTAGWAMTARRHGRDYERLPQVSEAHVTWALITVMTRRLTRRAPGPGGGRNPSPLGTSGRSHSSCPPGRCVIRSESSGSAERCIPRCWTGAGRWSQTRSRRPASSAGGCWSARFRGRMPGCRRRRRSPGSRGVRCPGRRHPRRRSTAWR
ncbi:hypothetical protein DMH18_36235 [Streptomyces sp. WAC 06783]|nr:hypothetical protein DMH18_36235 [Streptomyces sp. WAC 06783]